MPEGNDRLKWQNLNLGQLISYLIPILGAGVCFGLAYYLDGKSHFWHDMARDIGIAFVVALVVTVIYEVYARRRYERTKFMSALQLVMDEVIHPRVWEAVRNQIIERTVIRENNQITLSLEEIAELEKSQMVLCVDYNYELRSLRSRSVSFEVQHYLDDHIQCVKSDLPRFERVEIGEENYSDNNLKEKTKSGVFSVTLPLESRDKGSLPVRTRRKEIIYVPGSYNLVMNELCTGVRINLDGIPTGIIAYVRGPNATDPVPLNVGRTVHDFQGKILLPGQGFEFRFTPEVMTAATLPLFSPQAKALHGYYLEILSPTAGANVMDGGSIKGTANLPPDSLLWVFVGTSASPAQWRPLGKGVVEVKGDLTWEVPALYGKAGDTGSFNIAAIVVDQKTNRQLQKSYAKAEIAGASIPLPLPIDNNLCKTIAVEKPAIQLDRSRLERRLIPDRRGAVLAVKNERRLKLERRSRRAS
jgi:hypothetical protein